MPPVVASFLTFTGSLEKQSWKQLLKCKASGIMYGMRTFSAEFLNIVTGFPIVRMRFMLRSYFIFFSNKFRAGMADNEDTLASTPRRKLMSPASVISYREEQSRNERFHSVLPYKFYPGGKNYKGQNQTFLKIFFKKWFVSKYYSNFEYAGRDEDIFRCW